jgi:hypothetical protein
MFTDAAKARAFIQAGDATVTLRSKPTTVRYTYQVQAKDVEGGRIYFVQRMTATEEYHYIGYVNLKGEFKWSARSSAPEDSCVFKAFKWTWAKLNGGSIPDTLEIWHEGKCGRCGGKLTVPESIESGLGPVCAKKVLG